MDITSIINAVIALIAAVITVFIIPYIKKKTTKAQQENIYFWVQIAVAAAEQIFIGSDRGKEKYQFVVEFLKDKGIIYDEGKIRTMIESAVYDINSVYVTDTKEFNNAMEGDKNASV